LGFEPEFALEVRQLRLVIELQKQLEIELALELQLEELLRQV